MKTKSMGELLYNELITSSLQELQDKYANTHEYIIRLISKYFEKKDKQ